MKRNNILAEAEALLFWRGTTTDKKKLYALPQSTEKELRRLNMELVLSHMPHSDPEDRERALGTIKNLLAQEEEESMRKTVPRFRPLRERPDDTDNILARAAALLLREHPTATRLRPIDDEEEKRLRRLNIELVRCYMPHPDPADQARAERTIDNLLAQQVEEGAQCHVE